MLATYQTLSFPENRVWIPTEMKCQHFPATFNWKYWRFLIWLVKYLYFFLVGNMIKIWFCTWIKMALHGIREDCSIAGRASRAWLLIPGDAGCTYCSSFVLQRSWCSRPFGFLFNNVWPFTFDPLTCITLVTISFFNLISFFNFGVQAITFHLSKCSTLISSNRNSPLSDKVANAVFIFCIETHFGF